MYQRGWRRNSLYVGGGGRRGREDKRERVECKALLNPLYQRELWRSLCGVVVKGRNGAADR